MTPAVDASSEAPRTVPLDPATAPPSPRTRPAPTPASLAEVVAAVRSEHAATTRSAPTDLGPAVRDPRRSDLFVTAFVVDTDPHRLGVHSPTAPFLAGTTPGSVPRVVRLRSWEEDRLEVECDLEPADQDGYEQHGHDAAARGDGLPPAEDDLRLWATLGAEPHLRTLAERLDDLEEPGIGRVLLGAPSADLGPLEGVAAIGVVLGRDEERRDASAAAAVLAVQAGRSVLIVSTDPLGVDRIAATLCGRLDLKEAGVVVRVGVTALAAVGADPRLTVDGAVARRSPAVLAELSNLAVRARSAMDGPRREQWAPSAPTARLVAEAELAESEALLVAALRFAHEASTEHGAAAERFHALEPARAAFRRVEELARSVQEAGAEAAASALGVGRVAGDLQHGVPSHGPQLARQLLVAAEVAATRLDRRDRALELLDDALARVASLDVTRQRLVTIEEQRDAARAAHAMAERAVLRARAVRARAVRVIDALGNEPDLHDVGPEELRLLQLRHRALRTALLQERGPAIAAASVVLTTFADLVADPAVHERRYDHVLVERADAARPAEVLWATSRASLTVVLTSAPGDRPPEPLAANLPRALRRWLDTPVLELLGLDSPEAVAALPTGIVLD